PIAKAAGIAQLPRRSSNECLLQIAEHSQRQGAVLWPGEPKLGHLLEVEDLPDLSTQVPHVLSIGSEDICERRVGPLEGAGALCLSPQGRTTQESGVGNEPGSTIEPCQGGRRCVDRIPGASRERYFDWEGGRKKRLTFHGLMGGRIGPDNWHKTTDWA